MYMFKAKRQINPSVAYIKLETGNIDLNSGISMVIYFLDSNQSTIEKNVFIIQGDEFLNLGKNKNLKMAIIEKVCQATGCQMIAE